MRQHNIRWRRRCDAMMRIAAVAPASLRVGRGGGRVGLVEATTHRDVTMLDTTAYSIGTKHVLHPATNAPTRIFLLSNVSAQMRQLKCVDVNDDNDSPSNVSYVCRASVLYHLKCDNGVPCTPLLCGYSFELGGLSCCDKQTAWKMHIYAALVIAIDGRVMSDATRI